MDTSNFRTNVSLYRDRDSKPTLRFEHRYGHGPERIWQAVTDSTQHSSWFGFLVEIEPVVDGRFAIIFSEDHIEEGRVTEVEPPNLFVYTGRGDIFRWELRGDDDGCLAVLVNTVSDPGHIPFSAAGFHTALDALEDFVDPAAKSGPAAKTPSFDELTAHYNDVLRLADLPSAG